MLFKNQLNLKSNFAKLISHPIALIFPFQIVFSQLSKTVSFKGNVFIVKVDFLVVLVLQGIFKPSCNV
jgi:uncharacterized membrane protein